MLTCKLSDYSTEMWWFFGDNNGFFYDVYDDMLVYYFNVSFVLDSSGSDALWPKKLYVDKLLSVASFINNCFLERNTEYLCVVLSYDMSI